MSAGVAFNVLIKKQQQKTGKNGNSIDKWAEYSKLLKNKQRGDHSFKATSREHSEIIRVSNPRLIIFIRLD
jgi:hypothetical protein